MGIWVSIRPTINHPNILDSSREEAHITLAYLDKSEYSNEEQRYGELRDWFIANSSVRKFSTKARINGFATWMTHDLSLKYYQVALVESDYAVLHKHRERMVRRMDEAGFVVSKSYPFLPHITLRESYTPFTSVPELRVPEPFKINNLFVSRGSNHHTQIW